MAITKSGDVVTVCHNGAGTAGYTLALALVMQDVYDADVAGGWGVIHKQGGNQYKIDCSIIIGAASAVTFFKFIKEDILFCGASFQIGGGTMPWHYYPGRVYLGEMVNGEPVNGSTFTFGYTGGAGETRIWVKAEELHLYNSQMKTITAVSSKIQVNNAGPLVLNRSIIDGITDPIYDTISAWKLDLDDSVIQNANIGIYMEEAAKRLVLNNLVFKNCSTGIYNYGMGGITTFLNMKTKNVPLLVHINTSNWTLKLVNPDVETWHVNIMYPSTWVYREHSFELKVVDDNNVSIPGANVQVRDLGDNLVLNMNTLADGRLLETGTATSGNNTTLIDTSKAWDVDAFKGFLIKIIAGTGVGQERGIESNTATEIKIGSGFLGHWETNPDNTSEYEILPVLSYGYLSHGSGDVFTMETPHSMRIYKYGYQDINSKFEVSSAINWALTMVEDPYKTKSEAEAALIDGGCNP